MPPFSAWALLPEEVATIAGYGADIEPNQARPRQLPAGAGFGAGFKTIMLTRQGAISESSPRS